MVYAVSDLHGVYGVWRGILDKIGPSDTLYFLGDAADRGPDGWKILKEAMSDPRVIYIMGNHDEMLLDRFLIRSYDTVSLHNRNGGEPTWTALVQDDDEEAIVNTIGKLTNCEYYTTYTRPDGKVIYMSHSGSCDTDYTIDLIWDRSNLFCDPPKEYDYVVHGHTAIPHLLKTRQERDEFMGFDSEDTGYQGGAFFYGTNKNKVDIDNLTIVSHSAILLNLDTMESIIIKEDA